MSQMREGAPVRVAWVIAAAGGALGAPASAAIIDLTTSNSGTVNGVVFERGSVRPAGTGVIQSVVRLQANGTVQGYNTSGRPVAFNEVTDPNFTRNLRLSDLQTRTINGATFYEFLLDVNEPAAGNGRFISLDQVQIFTSADGSQTTANIGSLGNSIFNLDGGGDNWVRIDGNLSSGSGQTDVRLFVPTGVFAGAATTDFVYLFSQFGTHDGSEGGFEEWAALVIPTPTAVWAGGLCLAAIGTARLLHRRADIA
jgi:hypothetical protein